ncbi:hypothetical protein HGRIS_010231 [Hohenbuehelia grisea]|uniref:Uncharacterized protein n=1 Tax=Hohenbuehelia grisea TaxID=104357 RepID=A0ABR3J3V0_9AGAR
MKFTLTTFVALVAASLVQASPIPATSAAAPPNGITTLLTPTQESEWEVGSLQSVNWTWIRDPSDIDYVADHRAAIWLNKNGEIDYDHLLAGPFSKYYAPESYGTQSLTVPNVPTGRYTISLVGITLTESPEFCIFQPGEHC